MTTFDCRSCGGHWNEGPTRNHRYDCLCRKCLEALATAAGEALVRIGRPIGTEELNLKRDLLEKLRAANLLPTRGEEKEPK